MFVLNSSDLPIATVRMPFSLRSIDQSTFSHDATVGDNEMLVDWSMISQMNIVCACAILKDRQDLIKCFWSMTMRK